MVSSFERLYYEDSYCSRFSAIVTACVSEGDHYLVELDRTAFYPEGGGQPADTGTLDEANVLDVHERSGSVQHTTDRPLIVGTAVSGQIDWERRFTFMQQHSGEHILSGVLNQMKDCDNVGFHIGSVDTTLDFNLPLSEEELREAENRANQAVFENRPVLVCYPSPEARSQMAYRSKIELGDEVRVVTIPGSDACACCGIHVRTTGEIGLIKILSSQKYKGGTRLSIACGGRALADYALKTTQASTISTLLSVKSSELVEGVRRLQAEAAALKAKAAGLSRTLVEYRARALASQPGPLCLFEDDAAPDDLRALCLRLSEDREAVVAVFTTAEESSGKDASTGSATTGNTTTADGSSARRWRYAVGSRSLDIRPFSKALNAALNGTGGGNARIAQGTLTASQSAIEDYIRNSHP